MADAQQVDLSYGSYMVLRKPLFFWLRLGGFILAVTDVVSGMQTYPDTYRSLNLLFWTKILFACVYGFIFVTNVPLRIDLAPKRERWLFLQMLLGVALSLDLTNLSVFCIPFCVPVNRRFRWCGIAVALSFLAQVVSIVIYRATTFPQLAQIEHSPFKILLTVLDMTGNLKSEVETIWIKLAETIHKLSSKHIRVYIFDKLRIMSDLIRSHDRRAEPERGPNIGDGRAKTSDIASGRGKILS